MARSKETIASTAPPTSKAFAMLGASTCKSWASAATVTSASTSPPPALAPQCAITMGIGTILQARRILLLASGSSKAAAIAKAIEGPVTASVTASALQLHADVTFLVDQEAGALLKQQEYYQRVLEMTAILTPERL